MDISRASTFGSIMVLKIEMIKELKIGSISSFLPIEPKRFHSSTFGFLSFYQTGYGFEFNFQLNHLDRYDFLNNG